jgi:hypothetical protein
MQIMSVKLLFSFCEVCRKLQNLSFRTLLSAEIGRGVTFFTNIEAEDSLDKHFPTQQKTRQHTSANFNLHSHPPFFSLSL